MDDKEWARAVDQRLHSLETRDAVSAVEYANTDKRLAHIEQSINRLIWLVITGIIGGAMAFIINGGLSSV